MLRYMHVHLHWCEARDTLSAIATEKKKMSHVHAVKSLWNAFENQLNEHDQTSSNKPITSSHFVYFLWL